jgi:hypothetical protein
MAKTNAEKQTRYRQKQALKKFKDKVFKEWQLGMSFRPRRETPNEIIALLDEAASLPYGWKDEDFNRAWDRIRQLGDDFMSPQDDLMKDVMDGAGSFEEFARSPDPGKYFSDTEESISKTRVLASHLISALELSALSNSERAAAVMEAVRHVGRATANAADMTKSDAMIVCQASLPGYFDRPDWFLDAFTKWLANRLDEELLHELGKRLVNFQEEDML